MSKQQHRNTLFYTCSNCHIFSTTRKMVQLMAEPFSRLKIQNVPGVLGHWRKNSSRSPCLKLTALTDNN